MINCEVTQCRYNENNICINKSVSISFNCDSDEAICTNYEEKEEIIRNKYHIIELPSSYAKADYMVLMRCISTCFGYWDYIKKDINKLTDKNPIHIILDHTLHNGISNNRFILMNYDKNKTQYTCKVFNTTNDSPIRKISCDYFRNQPQLIEYSILTFPQKKMILKGIIL
ncbi:type II toxin-antitoxin system RnlB family antitoxin [Clostridium sp. MT-14]|uniref:type II toxin-antitoxin system RnlB family antitoxin n=1 Tax=Clostridium sp. MT-14 TaxID=3348360 RepID=UPI0035F418E5